MSQTELAKRARLQQPNIASIESGARRPSDQLLDRILRAADLRPSIPLEFYAERVTAAATAYGLSNVRVFGSVVSGADSERSDVDLLVEAAPGVDYLGIAAFRRSAENILGFPVDVVIDDGSAAVRPIAQAAVPL